MLVSLIRQVFQERKGMLEIASLGLAIYISGICLFYSIATRHTSGGSFFAALNRFLFWNADRSASFDVDWFNGLGIATVLPVAVIILSIFLSNTASLQSPERSRIALLLSYPTTRPYIFLNLLFYQVVQTLFFCVLSTFLLTLGIWISTAPIHIGRILGMGFSLWLLSLFFALAAFLFSNFTHKKWAVIVIPVGLLLLFLLVYLLPGFANLPSWFSWLSPLSPYLNENPLAFGIKPLNWLAQAGWMIAAGLFAWLAFERADLI